MCIVSLARSACGLSCLARGPFLLRVVTSHSTAFADPPVRLNYSPIISSSSSLSHTQCCPVNCEKRKYFSSMVDASNAFHFSSVNGGRPRAHLLHLLPLAAAKRRDADHASNLST